MLLPDLHFHVKKMTLLQQIISTQIQQPLKQLLILPKWEQIQLQQEHQARPEPELLQIQQLQKVNNLSILLMLLLILDCK